MVSDKTFVLVPSSCSTPESAGELSFVGKVKGDGELTFPQNAQT